MNHFSLAGETALITGGGTGLGFAIASSMAEAGARVVITGRRENVLRQAAEKLGPNAAWNVHDITEPGSVDALLEKTGDITILVNNAGVHLKKFAVETSDQEFRTVLDTHVHGAFSITRGVTVGMLRRNHGSILFIASMASLMGVPQVVAYATANSAYLGMVRTLAVELGAQGIRVNAIAPGWIETPMLEQALSADPERSARIIARTPMAKFGRPEDIGLAAVYLCSPAAAFVNGVVLPVDGGASIGF